MMCFILAVASLLLCVTPVGAQTLAQQQTLTDREGMELLEDLVLPDDYETWTAAEKEGINLEYIAATANMRSRSNSPFEYIQFTYYEDASNSINFVSDVLPYTHHPKRVHTVGHVSAVAFESDGNHPFTGLFQAGAPFGFIRFSILGDPGIIEDWGKGPPFIPGVSVKFFIDGRPSVNFVALNRLRGQEDGNFFRRNFSNSVPVPDWFPAMVGLAKFRQYDLPGTDVGISDLARYHADGTEVPRSEARWPFKLLMVPNATLREMLMDQDPYADLEETFGQIKAGNVVYEMYGVPEPGAPPAYIGKVRIKTDPVYTYYGDRRLFFRHQSRLEDFEERPEWIPHLPDLADTLCPFQRVWNHFCFFKGNFYTPVLT